MRSSPASGIIDASRLFRIQVALELIVFHHNIG